MNFVQIGYTRKAHGTAGELKFFVEAQYEDDFLHNERIFIDVKGSKVPYFIANVRGTSDFIVQLEEVSNRDQAILLQSKGIFLREQDLSEGIKVAEDDALAYAHLTDYLLRDKTLGDIAPIAEVLEMPQQEMALVVYKNRDVLIPLNEQLILSIDHKNKTVLMDLPDGLLE